MGQLPSDIVALIDSEKSLGEAPLWDETSDRRYVLFTAPLTVQAIATGGFQLRVMVSKRWVHRDAMMQLEFAPAGRRSEVRLWRLDWERFHTHVNGAAPQEHALETFSGSHDHAFSDNYLVEREAMRSGNLPAARPFQSVPNSLSDFLAFGGERFRINDIGRISVPVSGPDIFWQEND